MIEHRKNLKIFISYSNQDNDEAMVLYNRIKQEGFRPWIDKENLIPGQDWNSEIQKVLKSSHVFLVLLSERAINKAGFLHKEIKVAIDIADYQPEGSIFIIPVKLEECNIPDRLQLWHWVEIFEHNGYKKLIKALDYRISEMKLPDQSGAKLLDELYRDQPSLGGNYIAKGKNSNGTYYQGEVFIRNVGGNYYEINWQIGQDRFFAEGKKRADILNVIAESFSVSYIVGKDGTLNGIWGESATEKLIPEEYFIPEEYL